MHFFWVVRLYLVAIQLFTHVRAVEVLLRDLPNQRRLVRKVACIMHMHTQVQHEHAAASTGAACKSSPLGVYTQTPRASFHAHKHVYKKPTRSEAGDISSHDC